MEATGDMEGTTALEVADTAVMAALVKEPLEVAEDAMEVMAVQVLAAAVAEEDFSLTGGQEAVPVVMPLLALLEEQEALEAILPEPEPLAALASSSSSTK